MSRRLWLLRGWLSGWWLEKRCAWGGHEYVRYSDLHQLWRCRCGAREQTALAFLREITREG